MSSSPLMGSIDMPSSGYNALRVVVNPNDPDYLKKMGIVGALEGHHEVMQNQRDQAQQQQQQLTPPPEVAAPPQMQKPAVSGLMKKAEGIQNKPLRILGEIGSGLLTGAEALGEAAFPAVAGRIPGSMTQTAALNERNLGTWKEQQALEQERGKTVAQEQETQARINETAQQAEANRQSREDIATQNNAIRDEIAKLNDATKARDVDAINESHQKIAQMTNDLKTLHDKQQLDEFKQSQDFKTWKAKLDADTKIKVAEMTANKAPAAMQETAEFATGGLQQLTDAKQALTRLRSEGVLNSIPEAKLEDALFGAGWTDPSLTADQQKDLSVVRAALGYTSSAAMRAHTGRTSHEIYNDFKTRLGVGQGVNALDGALEQTEGMLDHYSKAATTENIQKLKSGEATTEAKRGTRPGQVPAGAITGTMNGKKGYVLDGKFVATE